MLKIIHEIIDDNNEPLFLRVHILWPCSLKK